MEGRFNQAQAEDQTTASYRGQIRQWVPKDLLAIADVVMLHYENSEWKKIPEIEVTKEDVVKWVIQKMVDPTYTVFVKTNHSGELDACIGVNLTHNTHPPHPKMIVDWCMWGNENRDLAELWKACKQWGKGRGAIMAQRGTVTPHYQIVRTERI